MCCVVVLATDTMFVASPKPSIAISSDKDKDKEKDKAKESKTPSAKDAKEKEKEKEYVCVWFLCFVCRWFLHNNNLFCFSLPFCCRGFYDDTIRCFV